MSNHQTYSIYSILGKMLLSGTTSEDETINTSTLPSIYIYIFFKNWNRSRKRQNVRKNE